MSSRSSDPTVPVRRLIDEVINAGQLDVIQEIYAPSLVGSADRWIRPFRASFPDVQMDVRELIVVGETVVGRFACSGTHLGDWLG